MRPRLGLNAEMSSQTPASSKKRAKGFFRSAMALALGVALCCLLFAQLVLPAGKSIPMWIFGLGCFALICAMADLVLGARRDFEEAGFLESQRAQALQTASQIEAVEAERAALSSPRPAEASKSERA